MWGINVLTDTHTALPHKEKITNEMYYMKDSRSLHEHFTLTIDKNPKDRMKLNNCHYTKGQAGVVFIEFQTIQIPFKIRAFRNYKTSQTLSLPGATRRLDHAAAIFHFQNPFKYRKHSHKFILNKSN